MAPRHTTASRLVPLDVLRAVALLLVLGRHLPEFAPGGLPLGFAELARVWQRGGWMGVDLFFVLSGFLISGLLFREHSETGRIRIGRFLIRRGFKIYPPFYFLLGAITLLAAVQGTAIPAGSWWSEALFVQNYGPAFFPHSWSLAVEEHFYLLLPLLLALFAWRGTKRDDPFALLPRFFVMIAIVVLAGRVAVAMSSPFSYKTHLFATHLRIDSLLFGVVLSYWHFYKREALEQFMSRFGRPLTLAAALLFLPPFLFDLRSTPWLSTAGLSGLYLASGLALLLALRSSVLASRAVTPLAFLGAHSYSIYLWHIPIRFVGLNWLKQFVTLSPLATAGVYLGASIAIGIAMTWFIETPALALRARLFRRPAPGKKDAADPLPVCGHPA